MDNNSFLSGYNAVFIERMYQRYIEDPASLDSSWILFFENYYHNNKFHNHCTQSIPHNADCGNISSNVYNQDSVVAVAPKQDAINGSHVRLKQLQIQKLITAYRSHGHLYTTLDPLEIHQVDLNKKYNDFSLENYNLSTDDIIPENIAACSLDNFAGTKDVQELVQCLEQIYCGNIGVEFAHLIDCNEANWLYDQFEQLLLNRNSAVKIDKLQLLQNLVSITGLEEFLHTKFVGAKRFSIQGGEAVIAALIAMVEQAANEAAEEVVIGMAHRGRLAALAEVTKKPYYKIISEFANGVTLTDTRFAGDVKYHMGYSNVYTTSQNQNIKVSITPNPSHLEAVNPIVMGQVRAKQDIAYDINHQQYIGILVHGDAAFSGQGIVTETLLLSTKTAYNIGGVIHLVINNQVGFTSTPEETYVGRYTTDIAKAIGVPILHVNADNPELVLKAAALAMAYRQKFAKDIVIDIVCYRKYGHNEGDEPMFTQPIMYNVVKDKSSVTDIYAQQLIAQQIISTSDYDNIKLRYKNILDDEFKQAQTYQACFPVQDVNDEVISARNKDSGSKAARNVINDYIVTNTGVDIKSLIDINSRLCAVPDNFDAHPRLRRLLSERLSKVNNDRVVDWAAAEQLAYASLLLENFTVRITGQDVCRGTFSHRHAVLYSQSNNSAYVALNNLSDHQQARFFIANSPLSEYGVLGFEYGYSLVKPSKQLVIWEAQFGDFSNGAQIVFDQFISSAESKWQLSSNIVMLLPHGYEGQGPEHSSARLERYLQLAAHNNIKVVYPTTPASFFHILRLQVLNHALKPLIVMSPKSLLRHKLVVSKLDELGTSSQFQPIIDEIDMQIMSSSDKIGKIIICSGKVFYDLYEYRAKQNINNTVVIRIEQLYPFPVELLTMIVQKYRACKKIIWCQEEPKNMGAWSFVRDYLEEVIANSKKNYNLQYVGRDAASSPAVGYINIHQREQENLVKKAFNI